MTAADSLAHWLRGVLPPGAALVADSRAVARGDAFFAYPGEHADGRRFVAQAVQRGAAAVVLEQGATQGVIPASVAHREVSGLKALCGPIASAFHGTPSARLDVLAVTGTNGKTSCSQWLAQGLDALGTPSAVIGTLGAGRGGVLDEFGLTTPDALSLQALFARFVAGGTRAVAIEASSIGLHQHRLDGTRITVAIHTNLTRDHLDYHGTLQAYAQAKARLFAWPGLKAAVVNLDDPWHGTMLDALSPGVSCIGYSLNATLPAPRPEVGRVLTARAVDTTAQGMRIELDGSWGQATVDAMLVGRFNAANLLAVAAGWLALGHEFDAVVQQLGGLRPVPGRLQPLAFEGAEPAPLVVVDYAHTPDALANALAALRPIAQARGGVLWCLVGAGGDRDPGKRPMLGEIAQRDADRVVLTSDNPRSESPEAILDAIAAGMTRPAERRDADRAGAIAWTVAAAAPADVVLLAGKGHETYQEVAGVRHPFDDRDHAARALAARSTPGERARV